MSLRVVNLLRSLLGALASAALMSCGSGAFHPCGSDRDCPAPQVCAGGLCVQSACGVGAPNCTGDSACGPGQHCAAGCCVAGQAGTCTRDADCSAQATKPVCDTSRKQCVGCLSARDCGPGRQCQGNACVGTAGCYSSSDCKDARVPICNVVNRTCVECLSPSDCADPQKPNCDATHTCIGAKACTSDALCTDPTLPRCLTATGQCVGCLGNGDCTGGNVCSPAHQCVPPAATTCVSDQECASNPNGTHCRPATATTTGACVACLTDDQCPGGDFCEQAGNTCKAKQCSADTDCASNPATPKCNTSGTPRLCVACLGNGDCSNGGLCQADHTCQAPLAKCKADPDCATNVSAPHCKIVPSGANLCVSCRAPGECGAGVACPNDCGPGQACNTSNACVLVACTGDADCSDPKKPHCQAGTGGQGGTCVQCTASAQCGAGFKCASAACVPVCTAATQAADCTAAAPKCKESPSGNSCVQCLSGADCSGATPVCSATNLCIPKPNTGCASNADCPAGQHVCDASVSPHACVQCLATSDCSNGDLCNTATKTCAPPPTGAEGQACKADLSCNAGLLCVNEGGPAPVCRKLCDPTVPANPCTSVNANFVCEWLAFDSTKTLFGICTAKNSHGAVGAACDPRKIDSCEWNLLCAPKSAATGTCAPLCKPGSSCTSGVCNSIVGALDSSGAALPMAYCGPASKWGTACITDTGSLGPDCGSALNTAGNGGLFCSPATLPAEVPLDSVISLCQYTPAASTATGGANVDCSALGDNACRSGLCLSDGTATCFAGCQYNADCTRDTGTYCFDVRLYAGTASGTVGTCEPTCRDNADCRGTAACAPQPNHGGNSWRAVCNAPAGAGKAGAQCTGGAGCQSGVCVTAAATQSIALGQTVPSFTATDGFCLGSCLPTNAADCVGAGTSCRIDVALPLSPKDTGDLGVAGRPNPGVCWGATCSTDANCAGSSADAATPRVCAPFKVTSSTTNDSTKKCTADSDCAGSTSWQALCNTVANNPNPGSAYGTSAGIYGPNGRCRALSWGLQCAPSLGKTKLGPGETCTFSTDCKTGHCIVATVGTGTSKYCFGGCASDADCKSGTHCRTGTYLGLTGLHCAP